MRWHDIDDEMRDGPCHEVSKNNVANAAGAGAERRGQGVRVWENTAACARGIGEAMIRFPRAYASGLRSGEPI
jgi:hypothetical protein